MSTMPSQHKRKILVTSALFYANGPLHLGHILEVIQTDIFYRFQKLLGNECYYICGSDAHGTPIMLKAEQLGMNPEQMVAEIGEQHQQDLRDLGVIHDYFYTTHSPENQTLVNEIYAKLQQNGDIAKREVAQAYDEQKQMFLPDRFVKGACPRCKTPDQYGDSCESCGATYSPLDMINPVSALSGSTPVIKKSMHYFFQLGKYESKLQNWMQQGHLQAEITNKLNEWFIQGLQDWDISRDSPYFGFKIPDTEEKYFYVWLDAPIGYMSSFAKFCAANPAVNYSEYWQADSKTELYHFIGKDIAYFHALFWPAILMGSGNRTPSGIFVHGYLTVNGQKMSKSRGTFIKARNYLNHLNPEYLRYYFAGKLNSSIEDIDLNLDDFSNRVNADLVGKVVNIASRCAGFIHKRFNGRLADSLMNPGLWLEFTAASQLIADCYANREYAKAIREIMALADKANQFIDEHKPWSLAKDESQLPQVQLICSMGLNLFKVLMVYLKPVLPFMAENVEKFLNIPALSWNHSQQPLLNHQILEFVPLMTRVDPEKIKAMLAAEH